MDEGPFRLGTRGSKLAKRQANTVKRALADHRYDVELVEVSTTGDELNDALIHRLGKTGAFVRELDERVLDGELDAAVHSMKDMPTDMPAELIVAATPERRLPHDVLVSPTGLSIDELPAGATIGTGSLRRQAQLARLRDDIEVEPVRGNIDTRLEKLLGPHLRAEREELTEQEADEWLEERSSLEKRALERETTSTYDALVLAAAGLERADLADEVGTTQLPIEACVPAPGQGALAITMRDTEQAERINQLLDHPPTRVATTVERMILAGVGGGCIAPIGVTAIVQGEIVNTRVQVLSLDGAEVVTATRDLPVETYPTAVDSLIDELRNQGADELIASAVADQHE